MYSIRVIINPAVRDRIAITIQTHITTLDVKTRPIAAHVIRKDVMAWTVNHTAAREDRGLRTAINLPGEGIGRVARCEMRVTLVTQRDHAFIATWDIPRGGITRDGRARSTIQAYTIRVIREAGDLGMRVTPIIQAEEFRLRAITIHHAHIRALDLEAIIREPGEFAMRVTRITQPDHDLPARRSRGRVTRDAQAMHGYAQHAEKEDNEDNAAHKHSHPHALFKNYGRGWPRRSFSSWRILRSTLPTGGEPSTTRSRPSSRKRWRSGSVRS